MCPCIRFQLVDFRYMPWYVMNWKLPNVSVYYMVRINTPQNIPEVASQILKTRCISLLTEIDLFSKLKKKRGDRRTIYFLFFASYEIRIMSRRALIMLLGYVCPLALQVLLYYSWPDFSFSHFSINNNF